MFSAVIVRLARDGCPGFLVLYVPRQRQLGSYASQLAFGSIQRQQVRDKDNGPGKTIVSGY